MITSSGFHEHVHTHRKIFKKLNIDMFDFLKKKIALGIRQTFYHKPNRETLDNMGKFMQRPPRCYCLALLLSIILLWGRVSYWDKNSPFQRGWFVYKFWSSACLCPLMARCIHAFHFTCLLGIQIHIFMLAK